METRRRPLTNGGAPGAPPAGGRWRGSVQRLTWARALVIVGLLVAALLVSRSCQQSQVRISQARAVSIARQQVDFRPKRTQIRLVRQGIKARAYWAVSLSVPGNKGDDYAQLTTVRVDANNGKVAAVNREKSSPTAAP